MTYLAQAGASPGIHSMSGHGQPMTAPLAQALLEWVLLSLVGGILLLVALLIGIRGYLIWRDRKQTSDR